MIYAKRQISNCTACTCKVINRLEPFTTVCERILKTDRNGYRRVCEITQTDGYFSYESKDVIQ